MDLKLFRFGFGYAKEFGLRRVTAAALLYLSRWIEPGVDARQVDKMLSGLRPYRKQPAYQPSFSYYDLSSADLAKHRAILHRWARTNDREISTVDWFIPDIGWVYGGGPYTIFRFADHFSKRGVANRFVIYDPATHRRSKDVDKFKNQIKQEFPEMEFSVKRYGIDTVPNADLAIATTWQSAYFASKFNKVKGKYYFAQDFEPWYYPSGSNSSLAEFTYRLGMSTITFGKWLRDHLMSDYNCTSCQDFVPCADTKMFKPSGKSPRKHVERVFFFGRPISERRAFEIGVLALEKIKKKYPTIQIVVAGWDLGRIYSFPFRCRQLGNLTVEQTAGLYRNCDVGIALATTNLSLVPLELMASGCAVLVNKNPPSDWLFVNRKNCVSTDPLPSLLAEGFDMIVSNPKLREILYRNGLKTVNATSWTHECERVYKFVVTGKYQR
jgi:glycosyltransferase involved in cell wall biosynthesis